MSIPAVCQTADLINHEQAIADLPAQRVWLLERQDRREGSHFAGAVVVLADEGVYIVVVVSPDPMFASARALRENRLRIQLRRDVKEWQTLDAALNYADELKRLRVDKGWIEVEEEPLDWGTI